jgi:hypothetical protein
VPPEKSRAGRDSFARDRMVHHSAMRKQWFPCSSIVVRQSTPRKISAI